MCMSLGYTAHAPSALLDAALRLSPTLEAAGVGSYQRHNCSLHRTKLEVPQLNKPSRSVTRSLASALGVLVSGCMPFSIIVLA